MQSKKQLNEIEIKSTSSENIIRNIFHLKKFLTGSQLFMILKKWSAKKFPILYRQMRILRKNIAYEILAIKMLRALKKMF